MSGTELVRISGKYSTACVLTVELTGQNTSGNYSTFKLRAYGYYGGGTSAGSSYSNVYISGTEVYNGSYRLYPGYTLLGSRDITIYHNNNGSFPGSSQGLSAYSYHWSGEVWRNIAEVINIPSIPRQAYVTDAGNFNDEQNPWLTFTNPGGFTINARLEFGGTSINRNNISNTGSYSFVLTSEERNLLTSKCISNSMAVRFVIGTCLNSSSENYWSWVDRTMTIINGTPVFNDYNFEDINEKTVALTGNNKNIVVGYSNIKVTIPSQNKAVALKNASMSKYRISIPSSTLDISYSAQNDVSGTINKVTSGTITTYAIDSRGNSKNVVKQAESIINYQSITKGPITAKRSNNGVGKNVTLNYTGNYSVTNFGLVNNSIKSATYTVKRTDGTEITQGVTNITPTIINSEFSFEGLIAGDTAELGFDISSSYVITVTIKDELSEAIYTTTLGPGRPNIALAKNGVGIMGKYDDQIGGLLQVGGYILDNEFSLEEKVVGIWYDGKPLYRKTVILDNIEHFAGDLYKLHGISNVEYSMIDYSHSFGYRNGMQFGPYIPDLESWKFCLCGSNATQILYRCGKENKIEIIIATLLYTKTTDEASA